MPPYAVKNIGAYGREHTPPRCSLPTTSSKATPPNNTPLMPYLGRDMDLHNDSNNQAFIFNRCREWRVFSRASLPNQSRLPHYLPGDDGGKELESLSKKTVTYLGMMALKSSQLRPRRL